MQAGESVKECFNRVKSLEKLLAVGSELTEDDDQIRNMLQGLPVLDFMNRDIISELGKINHEAVAMLVDKDA